MAFVARYPRLFVLTGRGCSTDSGIPDYRDADGEWKRRAADHVRRTSSRTSTARKRYWARSLVGWPRMRAARPNDAHARSRASRTQGAIAQLVTQNVDGLHQAAGSRDVIDLHGRIDVGALPRAASDAVPREQRASSSSSGGTRTSRLSMPSNGAGRRRRSRATSTSTRSTCRRATTAAGC